MPDRSQPLPGASLNLRQIEVFHAIMATGSISEAGRLLHVSQPAVSRALSTIEQRVGFALFERIKGRLHPTREASQIFLAAESIHAEVAQLNEMIGTLAAQGSGVLRIASTPSFAEWLVPEAVGLFIKRYPEASIKYRPQSMDALLPQLLLGQVDVAVSTVDPDHPTLQTRSLPLGQIVCVLPRRHRLADEPVIRPDMLVNETLIGYGSHTPLGTRVQSFWNTVNLAPKIEVRSPQTACAFVRSGVGVALIDTYGVTASLAADTCIKPIEPGVALNVHVSYSRTQPIGSLGKAFVRIFEGILKSRYEPWISQLTQATRQP
ncbi:MULTISPECIES: LysR family transcriptional regulator [unclassified Achromobacter]|uniref:LysR family transcriptional regulator n=1 Tax=unclassified Achromobacter TaxID=2626865 RepID=UPI000B51B7C1|nr:MULTISPECIES: LysR substrate-binding domain-containing protein [unclassified Achromobacter]OWT71532.1 LysR family transcriptional regulator [Achromobacter sp. HZ34]OWT73189.1 LysR family transcriptional regulator [Achromobacter sp. HZ28]